MSTGGIFFTDKPFSDLPISDATKEALANLNFLKMTHIQVHPPPYHFAHSGRTRC